MKDLFGYVGETIVPMRAASIHLLDRGFRFGDAVFDSARTVKHKIYKNREHVERLFLSLAAAQIEIPHTARELEQICEALAVRNSAVLEDDEEIWITPIVTRGPLNRNAPFSNGPGTLVIAAERLNFHSYAPSYQEGISLVTPTSRAIPSQCIDRRIKSLSRLQFGIAEAEVKRIDAASMPLMLDLDGNVTETTAANFFVVQSGALVTAPDEDVLLGISRATVFELAEQLQIPVRKRKIQLNEVLRADEAFITGTSFCMLPVASINGRQIGASPPGLLFQQLLQAWNRILGIDIAEQARSHLNS
ncbi:aminotransferase class IV [Aminobacter ciceronei]|uniref:Probable branched-chain-amino-acid aminotransferase n=1 Tax=Aminobacter ciceronei TaxID=150723 RepID=A0ABR6CH30_9HYPH|nr:aminotransferase class IV [Aminobacter ciceronei]MBA8910554.1 branched-chain amino acid aminotransferase [Aminobacter ciceronei]MBA9024325.1 branched-chain amino acid aminotransferase [Aminobacter ciceronei]